LKPSATALAILSLILGMIGFAAPATAKSPHEARLAFINGFAEPQEVFTVGVGKDSGPPQQITHVGTVLQLRWSPAGNAFAIQTLPFGTIEVVTPDGNDARIVATDAGLGGFSPDGDRLALVREAGGKDDIWVVDLDAGSLTPLVTFAVEGFTSHLAWSPDGERLAFDRTDCPGGTNCSDPHVRVVGADGTALETVATGTDPSWSPNSHRLAFSGPLGEVRTVSANGGPARTIAVRTVGAPTVLAWQPNGNLIAFFTGDQNPLDDTFSIATVRPNGNQVHTLPLHGFSAFDLAWSPNGENLAFTASHDTPDGFAFDVFGVSKHLDTLRNLTNTGVAFGAEWAETPTAGGRGNRE
jgi:Tol biopolymer transport system component